MRESKNDKTGWVAPLAGSVDRNVISAVQRAQAAHVAPLAGSVDRNFTAEGISLLPPCRSPRGERG